MNLNGSRLRGILNTNITFKKKNMYTETNPTKIFTSWSLCTKKSNRWKFT